MNPFEEYLGDLDVSKYTAMSFKMNLTSKLEVGELVKTIHCYARGCGDPTKNSYIAVGEHRQGKNEVPHIHINVCVYDFKKDSNESRRRNKYFEEMEEDITGITCKISPIKDIPAFEACLKYPWKEKLPVILSLRYAMVLPESVKLYMLESAAALFEASKAGERKRERAGERSKTLLGQIQEIVGDRSFQNYDEFKKYVAQEFFQPLDLEEYPDMSNFRKAIEKVAVQKKIVPYHYFI